MKNLARALCGAVCGGFGFVMALLVLGGCPMPVDDSSGGDPPADITWTAQVNGEAGTATSTAITITFSRAPEELAAGDITLTPGTGAADKGALSGAGTTRTLALNSVSKEGTVKLAVTREGIESGEKTVTLFKAPPPPGKGALIYTVTVPEGVVPAPESRIQIEKGGEDGEDGEIFEELNSNGFSAGVRPLTETITEASLELDPGLNVVDILLAGENGKSAALRDTVEIQEGVEAALVFEPPADEFLTGEEQEEEEEEEEGEEEEQGEEGEQPKELTALITIRAATGDSSGLKISAGGSGAARTRTLAVPNGVQTLYLAALKKSSHTLAISANDAAIVSKAAAAPVGVSPGSAKDILIVDSSAIAETGGSLNFVITVEESGRQSITYAVTLNIPGLTVLYANFKNDGEKGYKRTYLVGDTFDRSTISVTGYYSDGTKNVVVTDYEVEGFDSSIPGVITVRFKKSGMYARDTLTLEGSTSFDITILASSEARLIFPYGGMIEGFPQRGRYTVTQGNTLVIAPVLWRVPAGAAFHWTVSGTSSYTAKGEYLTFKPGVSTGNYNVTVTASFGGQSVSASTTVECVNGSTTSPDLGPDSGYFNDGVAPGQFVEPNWGDSMGGYGGSMTYKLSMDNTPGDDFRISGNAFGG
ncbi:MAG: bacterial Ig-like domain-containing protein, partial [Treponema sp.]|nr:bacterial Ig-like domain-containing protein [Treponema sp.]